MERAHVFIRASIGIVTVIESHRPYRQFVAEPNTHAVAHVVEPGTDGFKWIGRIWQQIPGVEENRAEKFTVDREGVLDIEDREKFAADGMSVIVRAEIALGKTAHRTVAAVEET